jgi:hypothetical protein
MSDRQALNIQKGIWIDESYLGEAGLTGDLEVAVEPGEIKITSTEQSERNRSAAGKSLLLEVSGVLSGPVWTSESIDDELYGDQVAES